nr:phage tail fiber protein [uncultured Mediterranean phage uvMED]
MADVTNYNIEDNSGANVRIDLNAVFAAIQSNNSKGSDLADSQCVAGMWFLRSDNNTLKIRGSGSSFTTVGNIDQPNLGLLSKSGGTMTGQFLADDSNSASAPAISFDTDTDLGLFRKTSNIMGFSSSGTEQLVFDANGITLRTQNEIRFGDNDSSHYIGLKAASTIGSSFTLTLPTADGSNGQFLTTNGSGVLSFTSSTGSVTVGSTSISLGGTATTIAGLTTLTSTNLRPTNLQDASGNNGSTPAQIQQGRAKAWVNFDGTSGGTNKTIRGSFNVTSVTDHATGDFTVNFTSNMPDSNYAVALSMKATTNNQLSTAARPMIRSISGGYDTSSFRICNSNVAAQQGLDPIIFNAIVFGD